MRKYVAEGTSTKSGAKNQGNRLAGQRNRDRSLSFPVTAGSDRSAHLNSIGRTSDIFNSADNSK